MKSFVYHSICTVFTILYVGSLSSYIYGLSCHCLYLNINIFFYISYIWSLPCYIKGFNLSMSIKSKQWFSVTEFFKNEERSLPRTVRKQIYTAREIATQDISQKISTKHSQKVFHQQILKRNLHKEKISEEKSLPNKIQIETSTTKHLTTQFPPKLSKENSLPNNT